MSAVPNFAPVLASELVRKDFSTGSRGFHANGKATADGVRYQVSAMAILIGSKQNPEVPVDATLADAQRAVESLAGEMAAKVFGSGKTGFYAQGKHVIAGQRYQVSAQAVAIA